MMAHALIAREIVQPGRQRAVREPKVAAFSPDEEIAARRSAAARRTGVQRLSALLSGISRNNSYEGRDPRIIPDSLNCGFVADLLGLNLADLAGSLAELERQGLVKQAQSGGLWLTNLAGLEGLADAR